MIRVTKQMSQTGFLKMTLNSASTSVKSSVRFESRRTPLGCGGTGHWQCVNPGCSHVGVESQRRVYNILWNPE